MTFEQLLFINAIFQTVAVVLFVVIALALASLLRRLKAIEAKQRDGNAAAQPIAVIQPSVPRVLLAATRGTEAE